MILLQRYSQTLIAVAMAGGLIYAGLNHFATASDVEQKFTAIQQKVDMTAQQSRKERLENDLFRLRQERKTSANEALIKRFESQLQDADQRLRDMEREKRK